MRATEQAALWEGLNSGRFRIATSVTTRRRALLLVYRASAPAETACPRSRSILERVLLGEPQKAVGFSLAISATTISESLKRSLVTMGLGCRFTQVPLALPLLAHALVLGTARASWLRINGGVERSGAPCCVVAAERPDWVLANRISEAEYAVACCVLDGKSHAEIAMARGTSIRTVANQCHAIFHKLRVCGRFELIRFAVSTTRGEQPAAEGKPWQVHDDMSRMRTSLLERTREIDSTLRGPAKGEHSDLFMDAHQRGFRSALCGMT